MREDIRGGLRDAGCPEKFIAEVEALGEPHRQTACLNTYRKKLLSELHEAERRLDCLDYLLLHLRRQDQG